MPISKKDVALLGVAAAGFGVAGVILSNKLASEPEPEHVGRAEFRANLLANYDTSNALIEVDALFAPGVPKDGIPALTDPETTPAADAEYPPSDARVVQVAIGDEAVAYPLLILNWHEIVNDSVGGVPIAVTYCPLCDSVAVFDRRLETDGQTQTLEFGVSGFLFNSNVVMYERATKGLWSQVFMKAIAGPHAGRSLDHLPVSVVPFAEFRENHPEGRVLTTDTGHERDYRRNPYERYFEDPNDHPMFGAFDHDDRLPPKTLGLGVRVGDDAWFVRADAAMDSPVTIDTDAGPITVSAGPSGVRVERLPEGASALQTFYHSWTGFHPRTAIVPEPEPDPEGEPEPDTGAQE